VCSTQNVTIWAKTLPHLQTDHQAIMENEKCKHITPLRIYVTTGAFVITRDVITHLLELQVSLAETIEKYFEPYKGGC